MIMGTCVNSGMRPLIRCALLLAVSNSNDLSATQTTRPTGAVPVLVACMHAPRARSPTLSARTRPHALRATASALPPLCCPYHQSSHRGPPSARTGCHVSSDALVSAWRSRHSVMCIRGLALPPPALAFLCPSPPLALGAFCPACGQAVGEPVPPADTHGN